MKPVRLTEKQKRFVDAYIETGNASEAARKAGYSKKHANVVGPQNLAKISIRNAIDARMKAIEDARVASAKEVLQMLTASMRGEVEEEVIVCEGMGEGVSEARKIKKQISARDRLKAAELLMKRYGLALSDLEKEEKKARTEALRKEMNTEDGAEEVTILDDTNTAL